MDCLAAGGRAAADGVHATPGDVEGEDTGYANDPTFEDIVAAGREALDVSVKTQWMMKCAASRLARLGGLEVLRQHGEGDGVDDRLYYYHGGRSVLGGVLRRAHGSTVSMGDVGGVAPVPKRRRGKAMDGRAATSQLAEENSVMMMNKIGTDSLGKQAERRKKVAEVAARLPFARSNQDWFTFKPSDVTADVERELFTLSRRGYVDDKRRYKRQGFVDFNREKLQVGQLVNTAVERFATTRVTAKMRKKGLADEILASKDSMKSIKKRFVKAQRNDTKRHFKRDKHRSKKKK